MLGKLYAVQGNRIAGLTMVEDKSVTPPSAPHGLTIQEDKNELILSWEPSEGIVDEYEICYDEHIDCTLPVGIATTVKLESPRVQPGKVYAMKVRELTKGVMENGVMLLLDKSLNHFLKSQKSLIFCFNQQRQL